MNRSRWFKATFVSVLICLMGLSTAPPAQAAVGDARWCPLLATPYTDASCGLYGTLQEAVNAAKADGRPGHIYALGLKTFTENVVADKLKGVIFAGNVNGAGVTTISGSITISQSSVIGFMSFTVTGGIKILNGKGPHQVLTNIGNVEVEGGKLTSGSVSDGTTTLALSDALVISGNTGSISLTKVKVTQAVGNGAIIFQTGTYPTMISQSKFTKNTGYGLYNSSPGGIIYLIDVSATQNGATGAQLTTGGTGAVIVTTDESKLNHFDKNTGHGLIAAVSGTASIILIDVTANKNKMQGANLSAVSGSIIIATSNSKGNQFNKNIQSGLTATTPNVITLLDVSASKNGGHGAQVINSPAPLSSIVLATSHAKRNSFDKNVGAGLYMTSDGPISAANISASKNGQFGAILINNGAGNTMNLSSTKARNTFDRNGQFGLELISGSNLSAGDISASRNGDFGAILIASAGAVSLNSSVSKSNLFDRNGQFGLLITSSTGQTLTDISASKNGQYGALLSNGSGIITLQTNHSKQNLFSNNTQFGLQGFAAGGIDIHNTTASKNGAGGTFDGFMLSTTNSSATLTCSTIKKNTGNGISAGLGTGTLFLKSTVPTGNGVDIDLVSGNGPTISSVSCPS